MEKMFSAVESTGGGKITENSDNDNEQNREIKKQKLMEELKTEPLKYALDIANVTNAEELVEKMSEFDTKANFENVFAKLKNIRDLKNIKIVFKSFGDKSVASYRASRNTLYIDNTYGNIAEIGDFYVTVLHELFHNVFKGADIASGLNIIYGLSDVKNTLHKLPIHNKYRHLFNTILNNVSKEDKQKHYGLSSTNEFISEAYSNPEFQNFLKTVTLENGKSLPHKITDLLLSVATINARIISKEITEKDAFTAFQNIDLNSLDLLEDFEKNIQASKKDTN